MTTPTIGSAPSSEVIHTQTRRAAAVEEHAANPGARLSGKERPERG